MPEGHTIHRLARDHRTWWQGEPLALTSPQGRFADGARMLDQCVLEGVDAVGKHLLYRFGDTTLHVHLGLFGRFRSYRVPPRPGGSVRLRMAGADPQWTYLLIGVLIIGAVAVDQWIRKVSA